METIKRLPLPKSSFDIDQKSNIKLSLSHNGNGWGRGINSLLEWDMQHHGVITCSILVYKLDHVVNTPIGGVASYDIDRNYPIIKKTITSYDDFLKISQEVEQKMLDYFK